MQQRHTSANTALFSNLPIRCQTHTIPSMPLPPVDRMRHTKKAGSHAHNRVLADTNNTLGRACNVAIAVDEARRVDVYVLPVID